MSTATSKKQTCSTVVAEYLYYDSENQYYGKVCRYEPKDFRTKLEGLEGKRPLYRCEKFNAWAPNTVVYIVEGEKDVHTLEGLGLHATTSMNGAEAVKKTDWRTLERFKKIVILPDSDEAGERYKNTVVAVLAGLSDSRELVCCYLPDAKDVSDFIQAGNTLENLQAVIEEHGQTINLADVKKEAEEEAGWLFREPPKREPFPTDALGAELAGAVRKISYCIGVTEAMAAQSVLAGISLVVQAHADVDICGSRRPTSLYCLTIAESGSRKTTLDGKILQPHKEWEREEMEDYNRRMKDYRTKKAAYDVAFKGACRGKKNDVEAIEAAMRAIVEPEKPLTPTLIIRNATVQALHYRLSNDMPYCGLFSSEGGTFIGGYSMNSDNVIGTIADLSEMWEGSGGTRIRVEKGASSTHGRRLALHMMVQPEIAEKLVGNSLIQNQGFLARMLLIDDESLRGKRGRPEEKLAEQEEFQAYCRRMRQLLDYPPQTNVEGNELKTSIILADTNALEMWWTFQQSVERRLLPGGEFDTIHPWANKVAEHAMRIAANLAAYEDRTGLLAQRNGEYIRLTISPDVMARAIAIANYYLKENLRFYAVAEISEFERAAQDLLKFVRERAPEQGGVLRQRDIARLGPNRLRNNRRDRLEVMSYLKEQGLLDYDKEKAWLPGRKP